jgi:hypothetical protein
MPDVVVEIAFDAGYSTPAASRTWTDVSQYLELAAGGIKINLGRSDEFGTADANDLTVTFDNSSGRFTPEKASGAYYPNVKIGRPIRVTATRVGGAASTRFLGYINDWAMSSAGANPTTTVTASSQIARLGIDSQFASSLDFGSYANLLSLYKLGDEAEPFPDTMGRLSGLTSSGGTVTPQAGLGPVGAGTAARFGPGATAITPFLVHRALPATAVLEYFFVASDVANGDSFIGLTYTSGVTPYLGVRVTRSGTDLSLQATHGGAASATSTIPLDSNLHHVAAYHDGSNLHLYVDGVLAATDSTSVPALGFTYYLMQFDASLLTTGTVDVAYLALSADPDGIADRAFGALRIGGGETASERLTAFADYAGVESTDFDTTTEELTGYSLYGRTMLEAMRAAEATDGGVLFDSAAGALTYNDRESRYTSTSAFTLDAASQQVEASTSSKLDRSALVNEATVTQTDADGVLARVLDQDSIDAYGIARSSIEIQGAYDACLQAAAWWIFIHGEPETRIPSLDVDLLPLTGANQDLLLAATVGTRFTVSGLPTEYASSSLEFFVEGYSESIEPEAYTFSLNVSARDAAKWDVWTVEDAVLGQYDAYPIAW